MSPRRTVDEVERSLDRKRAELESALGDLRSSARQAGDIKAYADRYKVQITERVQIGSEELVAGALVIGFLTGGGVSGTLHLPFKLVPVPFKLVPVPFKLVRATLGRSSSRSRLEAAMRQDRNSREVGRALAAVAAADGLMRSRRSRLWQLIRPTPRRLLAIGSAGGGVLVAMTDEETRQNFQSQALEVFEDVRKELAKRIEAIGK